ncbi:MAG: L,D-transpeptidase [Pseudorhodoplanes sp.]|nr:L,D-transpeptidase [Pseudorhodoplanes sp.]
MRIVPVCLLGAALISAAPASAAVDITIDKSAQRMTVAVDGQVRHVWPVSTGKAGYDTPNGTFKAFRMEADHYSKEWDDAPMPHSIFFTTKGHAIHGSFDVKRIGSPASHGCVRLEPKNAATLFALVKEEGVLKTTVTLTGSIPRGPAMARNDPQQQRQAAGDPMPIEPRGLRYGEPYGEPQMRQPRYAAPNYYYVEPEPYYAPRYQYYAPRGYAQPLPQPYYGNNFYRPRYRSYYYD